MKENIENNAESKFGNFLNFMKKFLAMSFFCAIAAFGFGTLNTQAITKDEASNYDIAVIDTPTESSDKKISGIPDSEDGQKELAHYDVKEGVLYYAKEGSDSATAYALERKNGEISKKEDLEISSETSINNIKVNKIHTQLIDDDVKNLTIKGYTNDGKNTDKAGNVTIDGTVPTGKKFTTLTVLTNDGKAVDKTALESAQTYFFEKKGVVANKIDVKTANALKLESNKVTIDESITDDTKKKEAVKTELEKLTVKKIDGGTEVKGTWQIKSPVTETCTAEFTPSDNTMSPETFNIEVSTYSSESEEKKIEKQFGSPETFGDHTFYVDNKGKTSVVLKDSGISWLREASGNTATWYGFENSDKNSPALPDGSIVSVKWYSNNEPEFEEKLKKAIQGMNTLGIIREDDNKLWIFELDAYKKNDSGGYEQVNDFDGKKIKVYVELGRDWDMSDIRAIWSDNAKERKTKIVEEEINGVKKHFARLELDHFSEYLIYDEKVARDILDRLTKIGDDAKAEHLSKNPDATEEELAKIAEEAITKAYNDLSQEDKDQLTEYLNNEFKKVMGDKEAAPTPTPDNDNKETTPATDNDNKEAAPATDKSGSGSSNKTNNLSNTTSSSKIRAGKDETLLALLFLLSGGGVLSFNLATRKKYFNI